MARNPVFTPTPPVVSESVRAALRVIVMTHLQANAATAVIIDAALQAMHPALADPQVWAVIKADLGL